MIHHFSSFFALSPVRNSRVDHFVVSAIVVKIVVFVVVVVVVLDTIHSSMFS